MVTGDNFKREADHHRLTHETKKRLAVSKKAKFDEGTKEIAQQMQREANETVKNVFGLEHVDMQPHGCLAKFAKGDGK